MLLFKWPYKNVANTRCLIVTRLQIVFAAFQVLRTSSPAKTKEKLMVLGNFAGFLLRGQLVRKECPVVKSLTCVQLLTPLGIAFVSLGKTLRTCLCC